jgi:hypothetical protein
VYTVSSIKKSSTTKFPQQIQILLTHSSIAIKPVGHSTSLRRRFMRINSGTALHKVAAVIALTCAFGAQAAPVSFMDRAAFDLAVAGLNKAVTTTLNFDSLTAPSLIASGDVLDGISFSYNLGSVSLQVTDGADTTSSPNFLSTNDSGVLQDGDDITLGFGARNAIGLYVMSLDSLIDDDFRLTVGTYSTSLTTEKLHSTLADGTSVYFLGIVDATSTFTSASITTSHDGYSGYFLWNADDIVTAVAQVPEPETWAMLLAGLGLVAFNPSLRARRSKAQAL